MGLMKSGFRVLVVALLAAVASVSVCSAEVAAPDYATGLTAAKDAVFTQLTTAWPVAAALFGTLLALRVAIRVLRMTAK